MSVCSDFEVCGTECTQKVPCVERVASGDNACFSRESVDDALGCFDNDRRRTGVDVAATRHQSSFGVSSANDHVHDEALR